MSNHSLWTILAQHKDTLAVSAGVASLVVVGLLVHILPVLVLAAVPIGLLVLTLFIRYPRIWLYTGVLVNYFWISSGKGDEDITLVEYALVAFIIGGLWVWLIGMVIIKRRRILRHTGDYLLLATVVLASGNILLALVNDDATVLRWLREYLLFYTMLYYLPWREHFTERKHIILFFMLIVAVLVAIGASNIWQYVRAASNVQYAFEVWTSRKSLNTHIFLCATILCVMGMLFAATRRVRLGFTFLAAFYTVVVVVSFSRGFWISGILGIVVTLWLLERRALSKFVLYAAVGAIVFAALLQVLFPDRAALIVKVIQARFASSTEGTKDISVLSRVYETQAVLSYIRQYFLGGTGLGTTFLIYEPFERVFIRVSFIHNGYLFVLMKLGLPLFLAFYSAWIYMMRKAYILARQNANAPLQRICAAGAFGSLVAFSLLNITSAIPEGRDGFYCLSVLYACVSFAEYLPAERVQKNVS
ncbi:MAG: O-antigen ligase family protein [Bacteroidota bacterium]|nr:O-antigen ligase family protein [Candidatus Kapabacteria bacterium]MDW8220842.1 O-antigen ligase family protein [Bacteroidota bacterium]